MAIEVFNKQEFYYSVDSNIGRFHSNLTNIKKELRKFITYNEQTLVNLDIKNAQPLFSGRLLDKSFYGERSKRLNLSNYPSLSNLITSSQLPTLQSHLYYSIMLGLSSKSQYYKGFQHYLKLIQSGKFYEQAQRIIFPRQPFDLEKIKTSMFMIFFSSNHFIGQKSAAQKRAFKAAFPEVYNVFRELKKYNHKVLSHLLQRTETKLIIENIAKRISSERSYLPIFTIHDSIATLQGEEAYVIKVMQQEIRRLAGLRADIGIEVWA